MRTPHAIAFPLLADGIPKRVSAGEAVAGQAAIHREFNPALAKRVIVYRPCLLEGAVQRISVYAAGTSTRCLCVYDAAFVIVVYLALQPIYTTGCVPVKAFLPQIAFYFLTSLSATAHCRRARREQLVCLE